MDFWVNIQTFQKLLIEISKQHEYTDWLKKYKDLQLLCAWYRGKLSDFYFYFKRDLFGFFFLSFFQCFVYVLVHVKDLDGLKGQSPHQQEPLSPTVYPAPETSRQQPRL